MTGNKKTMNHWEPGVGVGVFRFGERVEVLKQLFGDIWLPEYSFKEDDFNTFEVVTDEYNLEASFHQGTLLQIFASEALMYNGIDLLPLTPAALEEILGHEARKEWWDRVPDKHTYVIEALGFRGSRYDRDDRFDYASLREIEDA